MCRVNSRFLARYKLTLEVIVQNGFTAEQYADVDTLSFEATYLKDKQTWLI